MKITLKNIKLNYFKTPALMIDKLEFFRLGVVGESGSGKTNLIKVLCGLEEIESGEIYIGDREVGGIRTKNREIALLSEQTKLFIGRSVYTNLSYPLKRTRVKKREIKRRVVEAVREFDLGGLGRKVRDLDEKERIRVMVARTFIRTPKLLLVDEPMLFVGDGKMDYFYEVVGKALERRGDICAVFCSYDFDAIKGLCDKFIVLDSGEIVFEGDVEQLKNCNDKYAKAVCFVV